MVVMKWKIFAVLFEIFVGISASTHWVVTENGRVQSQVWKAICVILHYLYFLQ
jgi:hypothetical protein